MGIVSIFRIPRPSSVMSLVLRTLLKMTMLPDTSSQTRTNSLFDILEEISRTFTDYPLPGVEEVTTSPLGKKGSTSPIEMAAAKFLGKKSPTPPVEKAEVRSNFSYCRLPC